MKVYGTEITQDQQDKTLAAMCGTFTAFDIEFAAIRSGVPHGAVSSRMADRLLQRERRAGRIKTNPDNKRQWIAVEQDQ